MYYLSEQNHSHQILVFTAICTKAWIWRQFAPNLVQVRPNPGFLQQLAELEHTLRYHHIFWICLHLIFQTFVFSFFFSFFSAVSDFVFSFYNFYLKWIVHIDLVLSSNYFLSSRHSVLFQHNRDRGNNETTFNTIFDHQHTHG